MEVAMWTILGVLIAGQFGLWAMLLRVNNGLRKELSEIAERLAKIEVILGEHGRRLGKIEGISEEHEKRLGKIERMLEEHMRGHS